MDTMTTLPARITVAGQELRLATIETTNWDQRHSGGQFYVLPESSNPVGTPVVVAPPSDPRSEGMWDDFHERGLPGFPGYLGWMVSRIHVEYVQEQEKDSDSAFASVRDANDRWVGVGSDETTTPDVPTPDDERIREAVAAERRRLLAEFDEWKRNATEVAHRYAERNELCREFDRCMEEIGLEPRVRTYRVTLTRTVDQTYTFDVEASDADTAATDRDLWPDLYYADWNEYSASEPEVEEVERDE